MGQFIKTLSEDSVDFFSRFNSVSDSYNVGPHFGSGSVFHGSISKYSYETLLFRNRETVFQSLVGNENFKIKH